MTTRAAAKMRVAWLRAIVKPVPQEGISGGMVVSGRSKRVNRCRCLTLWDGPRARPDGGVTGLNVTSIVISFARRPATTGVRSQTLPCTCPAFAMKILGF